MVTGENFGGGMEKYLIIGSLIVMAFLIGRDMGYKDGVHNAYYATLSEIRRQIDSPFPVLIVDEFFTCRHTGDALN